MTMENWDFITLMEEKARRLVHKSKVWRPSPLASIERELALTLKQIDEERAFQKDLEHRLLDVECLIDTELMHMEARTPKYSDSRFPERERWNLQLRRIEEERRSLEAAHQARMRGLHWRLIDLVNKKSIVDIDDGD